MCTDSQGYGEPYLEENDIVFRIDKNIRSAELIWPVQNGTYDDNFATIAELGLLDIQEVISTMSPMEGAVDFVAWLKERFQLVILSDTFYEFSEPLMRQLNFPTLLCHRLIVDSNGFITDYKLRQKDPKRQCVKAFHKLNFRVILHQCMPLTNPIYIRYRFILFITIIWC